MTRLGHAHSRVDLRKRSRQLLSAVRARRARPDLTRAGCHRRVADVDVVQDGVWPTALLGPDRASVRRSTARCEAIALAD